MMKRKLAWFMLIIGLLCGATSCEKEKEETDQRLINKKNKEAGEQFLKNLKSNASQNGMKETISGVLYKIETPGSGTVSPFSEDSINVSYTGKLIDGTIFEVATEVNILLKDMVPGFREGLHLMKEGATHTLYIPYYLAYNTTQKTTYYKNKTITIQPYSVLIFEITLNEIIKN